jgi:hypothetical protein
MRAWAIAIDILYILLGDTGQFLTSVAEARSVRSVVEWSDNVLDFDDYVRNWYAKHEAPKEMVHEIAGRLFLACSDYSAAKRSLTQSWEINP